MSINLSKTCNDINKINKEYTLLIELYKSKIDSKENKIDDGVIERVFNLLEWQNRLLNVNIILK